MKKKQMIQLLAGIVVLAALVVVLILSRKKDLFAEEEPEAETYDIFTVSKDDVTGFSYYYEKELITLAKSGDEWTIEGSDVKPDTNIVDGMLNLITDVKATALVDGPGELSEYGLKEPKNTVTLMLKDGSSKVYYIGDREEMNGGNFAKTDDDSKVYVISSTYVTPVDKSIDDLAGTKE